MSALKYAYVNALVRSLKTKEISKEKLFECNNLSDLYSLLQTTVYKNFLISPKSDDLLSSLEKYYLNLFFKITKNLNKNEKHLFTLFFFEKNPNIDDLKKAILKISKNDKRDIEKIIKNYIDVLNLITILKYKIIYSLKIEKFFAYLIPYGNKSLQELQEIASSENLYDFSSKLGLNVNDYSLVKKAIFNNYYDSLKQVWYGYPFKLSVPFVFLQIKQKEIKNISSFIIGLKYSLDKQEIEKMVV
ncbi:V/A-type H+/Na+-transporting ATPase subunit C [Lebetimonas natsushimae]|uniref:V/A-type H+/Na+-transporting ATPase subunit C n=1 Tax=Lebetimonas natsushimae TaxID=1936991 RepID=A0A292YCQ3_9BACT|nr:V-type ATPase subunit [Lebetimonas natsushimae]GAX87115.1 V/A-type H+/Na+-transporting ATPase subunit C [Lebetimonas natsushimae]